MISEKLKYKIRLKKAIKKFLFVDVENAKSKKARDYNARIIYINLLNNKFNCYVEELRNDVGVEGTIVVRNIEEYSNRIATDKKLINLVLNIENDIQSRDHKTQQFVIHGEK